MKNLGFVIFFITATSIGCTNPSAKLKDINTSTTVEKLAPAIEPALNILGSYVGAFGDNKITLLITKIANDSVVGRSIVGGNDRPFTGTIKKEENKYTINAKEPGDDKNDGTFYAEINEQAPNELNGSWKPNKTTNTVSQKEFKLNRKTFVYLKDVGQYSQASKRILTDADLGNLMKDELNFMRNEIFARHGYCFQKKELRQQFENLDWYVPNTIDIKNKLTDIEKINIKAIKTYEKYADDFGDDFGR